MATVKVTAPVKVTGEVAGVTFVKGVAEVDAGEHRQALAYFRRHGGYTVEPVDEPAAEPQSPATPPAGNASQEEWAAWVLANVEGVNEAEVRAMKRDDLRDVYGPKQD